MKQSSIEWFINELDKTIPYQHISKSQIFTDIIEQAKAMHKEEMIQAWKQGDGQYDEVAEKMSVDYYNETFGGDNEQQ